MVQAASGSFCRAFSIDCNSAVGSELFALGNGEWNIPQLRSLLTAIASVSAAVDAYEIQGIKTNLPLHARILRDETFIAGRLDTRFLENHAKP